MLKNWKTGITTVAAAAAVSLPMAASAELSDDVLKIGVLSDMSGVYKTLEGPGAVIAAEMAVEDFGGFHHGQTHRDRLCGPPEQGGYRCQYGPGMDR